MSARGAERSSEPEARGEQRRQQAAHQRTQQALRIAPAPPPYESAETPLERLGPGFAYLGGVIGGAFILNLFLLAIIAASHGS
jgi:hypothetical protein